MLVINMNRHLTFYIEIYLYMNMKVHARILLICHSKYTGCKTIFVSRQSFLKVIVAMCAAVYVLGFKKAHKLLGLKEAHKPCCINLQIETVLNLHLYRWQA